MAEEYVGEEEEEGAGRGREVCCSAAAAENPVQTDAFPPLQHGQEAALKLPAATFSSSLHADSPSERRKSSRPPQAHPFVLSRTHPFHVL